MIWRDYYEEVLEYALEIVGCTPEQARLAAEDLTSMVPPPTLKCVHYTCVNWSYMSRFQIDHAIEHNLTLRVGR